MAGVDPAGADPAYDRGADPAYDRGADPAYDRGADDPLGDLLLLPTAPGDRGDPRGDPARLPTTLLGCDRAASAIAAAHSAD